MDKGKKPIKKKTYTVYNPILRANEEKEVNGRWTFDGVLNKYIYSEVK